MEDTNLGMFVELIDQVIEDGAVLEAIDYDGVSAGLRMTTFFCSVCIIKSIDL